MDAVAASKLIVDGLTLYGAAGLVVAAAFVVFGVKRPLGISDGVTAVARLLFVPAATALWPLVLCRWLRPRHP